MWFCLQKERHTVFLWISTWKAKSQNASNPLKRKLDQIFSVWHAGNTVLSLFRPPFEGKVYITKWVIFSASVSVFKHLNSPFSEWNEYFPICCRVRRARVGREARHHEVDICGFERITAAKKTERKKERKHTFMSLNLSSSAILRSKL